MPRAILPIRRARRRAGAARARVAGRPGWSPSCVRGSGRAGQVASGRGGVAIPVASALTALAAAIILPRGLSPGRNSRLLVATTSALPAIDEPMTDGSLTKTALIEEVAHAADLTKKRAEIIVDTLFGSIAEALHQGEKVELRGFGSFRLRRRGPHRGRNPRTGDQVDVPSRRVAYFKPGKDLKELINREPPQPVPTPLSE